MTQAETHRSVGKPRAYDEDQLLERVSSVDELVRVRDALEANGEGLTARNAFSWLTAKWVGAPSGVSRQSEAVYRAALARLPHDPLTPTPRRRRSVARNTGRSARIALVGAPSGIGALVCTEISCGDPRISPAAALLLEPPIMLHLDGDADSERLAA